MNIRNIMTGAAVAAVLAVSGAAEAQLLGGGANGSLGGSITGGLGNLGGTATGAVGDSLRGSTDALGRVRETGADAVGRAGDAADAGSTLDAATGSVDEPSAKPRRARRGTRRAAEPVEPAAKETESQPKANAGGHAKADGALTATGDGQASGQAGASVGADASIEK